MIVVVSAVQADARVDDVRIRAEASLPERWLMTMTGAALPICDSASVNDAAEERLDAERLKHRRRDSPVRTCARPVPSVSTPRSFCSGKDAPIASNARLPVFHAK